MTVVVVDEGGFRVVVLAAPLDRLGDITSGTHFAVGCVGIGGTDVSGRPKYFADVFRQIPTIGVPGAVELDSQRTSGDGLGRVPGDVPERRVCCAGEVERCDLQVATVDVTLV